VKVTDTGIGMSSEIMQRIFEPFFSTKDEGTGMGLAMVYGIVKNHDGAINVHSEVGKGSTFKIYLPAVEKKVTEERTEREEELPHGSESILLVDDEEHVRNVGRAMLESFGYRVYLANDGIEAGKIYAEKKNEIELVLLDMVMPEIGGKETYRRLKKIDSDVRVVLISGYSINNQVREILNEGAMDFIQKPFDVKTLASIVRKVLDRSVNYPA
jgi:CheY-like chemotaxis protein